MATISKTGKNYKVTVSNGYDINGKQIRESTTYTPDSKMSVKQLEKALNKFAYEFEEKVKSGKYFSGEKTTLKSYIDIWLVEYAKPNLEETTYDNYIQNINLRILPSLGHLKIAEITPLILQSFYNSLGEDSVRCDGKTGPYAPGTIKKTHAVLSSMLTTATTWQLIDSNPCDKVSPTSRSKKKKTKLNKSEAIKYFNPEQVAIFLRALNTRYKSTHKAHNRIDDTGKLYHVNDYTQSMEISTQLKVFFILALFGGFRKSEQLALTWNDIDFENNTISINKATAYVNHKIITKSTKNDTSIRTVSISTGIIKLLKCYKSEQNRYRLTLGDQWQDGNYLFIQYNGKQMNPSTPYQAFKKVIKRYNETVTDDALKLPNIPLHGLRHTSATLMIADNIDVRTVSGRLGHAQTSTTMNIYAHNLHKKDEEAAESLDKYFSDISINTK